MAHYSATHYNSDNYSTVPLWYVNLSASDASLKFAYDFEGTTGAVIDSGPTGNDATNVGATRGVIGKIGNCFDFSSDYVSVPNQSLDTSVSFSAWVNHNTSASVNTILGCSGSGITLQFAINSSNNIILYLTPLSQYISTATVTTSTWNHVAFTIDNASVSIYINGVKETYTLGSRGTGALTTFRIGQNYNSISSFNGKIDMPYYWNTALSDAQINDLYNSGNALEYLGATYETFTTETTKLKRVGLAATFNSETTILKAFVPVTFHSETTILKRQKAPVRFFSETTILKKVPDPVTFNSETTILKKAVASTFNSTTQVLRREGAYGYFFDLRDSDDIQVATATGTPPTTVFTDLFTGLADGSYTVYARAVKKYKNLENTINETLVKFKLVAGIIQPLLPNIPLSVVATKKVSAGALITWGYNPTGEEVAPTDFQVYTDGAAPVTVAYTGATSYSLLLGPLSEVSTVFSVSSRNGTDETALVSATAITPDGTPPITVPIQVEVL